MFIPMFWTAVTCFLTGTAVYCNCKDVSEDTAVLFTAVLSLAFTVATLMLCLVAGM